MQEDWIRWEPLKGITGKYDVDYISDGKDGLVIKLYSETKETKAINVVFKDYADTYRHTNESFCFKVFGDLSEKYGAGFYGQWSFFKIINSDYVQWLSNQSCTYANEFTFIHFCFIGSDSIVDILARYEPIVTFLD